MPQFCVTTRAQPPGEHIVHDVGAECSLLPDFDDRIVLGECCSCEAAMNEARKHFASIDGCPECVAACNERLTTDAINATVLGAITTTIM